MTEQQSDEPKPLEPSDVTRALERLINTAHHMALQLRAVASRDITRQRIMAVEALLAEAATRANEAAWEFVGDRVHRQER